jgi:hypothetical protein
LNAKPELQCQILNKNISETFSFSVLFFWIQIFSKTWDFPYVSIVNEALVLEASFTHNQPANQKGVLCFHIQLDYVLHVVKINIF